MVRSPYFRLIVAVASFWLACSSTPENVNVLAPCPAPDGMAPDLDRTAADGATPDGAQTNGEAGPVADGDARLDGALPDSAAPGAAPDVAPDRPPTALANGAPCTNKGECRSAFCVSGVCCTAACDGGCSACAMARTGKPDGVCAPDKALDKQKCGTTCAQLAMNIPAVLQKVCDNGACVPAGQLTIVEICQKEDRCTTSFCDQPDPNTARCIYSVCAQQGTCCCGSPDGTRMCAQKTTCTGDRSCS